MLAFTLAPHSQLQKKKLKIARFPKNLNLTSYPNPTPTRPKETSDQSILFLVNFILSGGGITIILGPAHKFKNGGLLQPRLRLRTLQKTGPSPRPPEWSAAGPGDLTTLQKRKEPLQKIIHKKKFFDILTTFIVDLLGLVAPILMPEISAHQSQPNGNSHTNAAKENMYKKFKRNLKKNQISDMLVQQTILFVKILGRDCAVQESTSSKFLATFSPAKTPTCQNTWPRFHRQNHVFTGKTPTCQNSWPRLHRQNSYWSKSLAMNQTVSSLQWKICLLLTYQSVHLEMNTNC